MALAAILPHVTPSAVQLQFPHDDLSDLAADLMHDEPCMQLPEARRHAAFLLDELAIYAAGWDHLALRCGHPDALPG